jgi:hypothetical protein
MANCTSRTLYAWQLPVGLFDVAPSAFYWRSAGMTEPNFIREALRVQACNSCCEPRGRLFPSQGKKARHNDHRQITITISANR